MLKKEADIYTKLLKAEILSNELQKVNSVLTTSLQDLQTSNKLLVEDLQVANAKVVHLQKRIDLLLETPEIAASIKHEKDAGEVDVTDEMFENLIFLGNAKAGGELYMNPNKMVYIRKYDPRADKYIFKTNGNYLCANVNSHPICKRFRQVGKYCKSCDHKENT